MEVGCLYHNPIYFIKSSIILKTDQYKELLYLIAQQMVILMQCFILKIDKMNDLMRVLDFLIGPII
jgi:hypothetical protein